MPLPVQTSSEGLKKEGEKSKYNDYSRARVPPILSLDGPLQCVLGKSCWQKQAGLDNKDCSMAWSQRERRLGQFIEYRNVAHENMLFAHVFQFCKFNLSSDLHEVLGAFTQHCFQLKPENFYVFWPFIYTTTVFWRFEDGHFWKWYTFIYIKTTQTCEKGDIPGIHVTCSSNVSWWPDMLKIAFYVFFANLCKLALYGNVVFYAWKTQRKKKRFQFLAHRCRTFKAKA